MIDDEKQWAEECDRRLEERNQRLDDEWEYRDTEGYPADEEKNDDRS